MLKELASHNNGLCIITSRLNVTNLSNFEGKSVKYLNLEDLLPNPGAQLLREFKVNGSISDLEKISEQYKGHCLTLTLLGSYISDVYHGDIRKLDLSRLPKSDIKPWSHAFHVLSDYEEWFGKSVALSLLKILGLFDRPINI